MKLLGQLSSQRDDQLADGCEPPCRESVARHHHRAVSKLMANALFDGTVALDGEGAFFAADHDQHSIRQSQDAIGHATKVVVGAPTEHRGFPRHPAVDGEPPRTVPWQLSMRDRKGGDMDEWPIDLRVREFPRAEARA